MLRKQKMIELNKPALIKVVKEVASEVGVDPNALHSKKAKVKKSNELKKKRYNQYVWTTTNRLKPEKITDIHIHPNTKPVAITVNRNNDQRNFKVHNPFRFGDFGIIEWDELSVIIPKKKNKVVGELMTSLRKKYNRLKMILGELRISPSLPLPEQTLSLSSSRKRKAFKLEPEVYITGLECNRSLPEWIPFMNNKVIETPKHEIFFIDAFKEHYVETRRGDIWVKEEENMRRMMMMKKIDGLNNEKGKRKWQSMVLEMKIEEIVCSKKEVPARV
ncbi:hypothetical protein Tco_0319753 [Tanacetum coccineum]